MDMKKHFAGHITDGGVRVRGRVIKEAKGTEVRVFGRLGLVGSHQDKVDNHGGVDCNGIVDQRVDYLLDKIDRFGVKAEIRVVGFGVLDAGTKYRAVPEMWGILGASRHKVFKFVQVNVGRHGEIAGTASVISGEVESA